jgi:hypothetical protein
VRSFLTALAVLLVAAPAARAEISLEYGHLDTGDPLLLARVAPSGDERVVEWRVCPPDGSACTPPPAPASRVAWQCPGSQRSCALVAQPGESVAGTTFEALFEVNGVLTTRRTPAWTGRPTSGVPASVSHVVLGQRPRITPGTWSGGWSLSPHVTAFLAQGVFVCRDVAGTDCLRLERGDAGLARLLQRWAGWYLFVDEFFVSGLTDPTLPATAIAPVRRIPRLPALTPTRSRSAPVHICCVLPEPAASNPPWRRAPPTASVRARAQRGRDGRLHVARVRCAVSCAVRLTVAGGGRTVVRLLTVRGERSLAMRGRRGTYRVRVVVDGRTLARGRSRAR